MKDGITRNGTVIYTVGKCAIRDDGRRLHVSRGSDRAGLETAIKMAVERYGGLIAVNGSAAFKEQIVAAAAADGFMAGNTWLWEDMRVTFVLG